ncbi:P1 family peptidase [Roseateles terrae]|uniref:L-aminopeptidase/D-esterase-like protein n=1 Tax=Roseateles terrae TaxID=431060 RepID=A0ABR6GPY1_9BURK|nr:P1 family peptidase [Roseateles terrae]MBB3194177.1 L-aminopeptidase/D-esterase-like protein [Roseateles terrae]OWQ88028.1 peptidase S58 [Roseateles terrae]
MASAPPAASAAFSPTAPAGSPGAARAAPAAPSGSLCDVAGLKVGHWQHPQAPTGCTVILCEQGAVAGVDVRGAAPGTRETDLLRPENTVPRIHGLVLSGGSAFGLSAADGVMRWLAERGHGFQVGRARVPIVPAAVLFDLWLHGADTAPNAAAGQAACDAATNDQQARGNVGAGTGATVGKLLGVSRSMKGGLGMASLRIGGVTLAAMVAVNAVGDVVDPRSGEVIAGSRGPDGRPRSSVQALLDGEPLGGGLAGSATTLGVIATDARLTKAQASKLAQIAHDGFARSIQPVHTVMDGDVIFAVATGAAGQDGDMALLGAVAAEVVARAVVDAIRSARSLAEVPAAFDQPARAPA